MLLSKANLMVIGVAGQNPKQPGLHRVHVSPDGATVAANGQMFMAIGPTDESKLHFPDVGERPDVGSDGVGLSLEIAAQAIKNVPRDKRPSLQHVAITRCDERKVELTTTDTVKEQRVSAAPMRGVFPEWRSIIRNADTKASVTRICVNRRDLMKLLDAFDKACGDGEDGPVFLTFGGPLDTMVLRGRNYGTRQQVIGIMAPADTGGQWLVKDDWEEDLLQEREAPKKVRKVRKVRK